MSGIFSYQTYILRIEVIMCALALAMHSLYLIFSLRGLLTFLST